MSTTRKIEGLSIQLGNRKFRFTEESGAPMATEERATLVIGGKCLTEEEHEAEFQRRAKAMLVDLLKSQSSADVANGWQCGATADWSGIATRHGIKLP